MKLFNKFSATICLGLSLASLSVMQSSCDSSSDEESSTIVGVWTMNTAQFESGEYKFSMRSSFGPDIELIPSVGGTAGVMSVGGVSTPVNFVYTPEAADGDFPRSASLQVVFVEPAAQSMISVLSALGVRIENDETGEPYALPEGSTINFFFGFTPYASVQTSVVARPSEDFNEVFASWTSFDGLPSTNKSLGAWVLLDMLQTEFKVVAMNAAPIND